MKIKITLFYHGNSKPSSCNCEDLECTCCEGWKTAALFGANSTGKKYGLWFKEEEYNKKLDVKFGRYGSGNFKLEVGQVITPELMREITSMFHTCSSLFSLNPISYEVEDDEETAPWDKIWFHYIEAQQYDLAHTAYQYAVKHNKVTDEMKEWFNHIEE